jgi:hypothetical protein
MTLSATAKSARSRVRDRVPRALQTRGRVRVECDWKDEEENDEVLEIYDAICPLLMPVVVSIRQTTKSSSQFTKLYKRM